MSSRPACVENKHLFYLDELRASGVTNMFGARPYIVKRFRVDDKTAAKVLVYWMESFKAEFINDGRCKQCGGDGEMLVTVVGRDAATGETNELEQWRTCPSCEGVGTDPDGTSEAGEVFIVKAQKKGGE
jgi:hypothetical protein